MIRSSLIAVWWGSSLICTPMQALSAQTPAADEVRQLVTFSFLPGRLSEAIDLYRDRVLPLYEHDDAMLSFRAFREVESPIPLDLLVVSAYRGMAGMDESNARLRERASRGGTTIGAIYAQIASLSSGHTDQFVEMLPSLGSGDPASRRLTALVWYRIRPERANTFESALRDAVAAVELERGVPSATGRFLVSDGWHYLRFLGFDSLERYQDYWSWMRADSMGVVIDGLTLARREVILASIPDLAVH